MQLILTTLSLAVLATAVPQDWGFKVSPKGTSVKGILGELSLDKGGIHVDLNSPQQERQQLMAAKAAKQQAKQAARQQAKAKNPLNNLFGGNRNQPKVIVVPSVQQGGYGGRPQQGGYAPQQGYAPQGPPQGPPQGYAPQPAPWNRS